MNPLCLSSGFLKYGKSLFNSELKPREPNCAKSAEKETKSFSKPISFVVRMRGNNIAVVKKPMMTPI